MKTTDGSNDRLNLLLDDEEVEKMNYLRKSTGIKQMTEVVRFCLTSEYKRRKEEEKIER